MIDLSKPEHVKALGEHCGCGDPHTCIRCAICWACDLVITAPISARGMVSSLDWEPDSLCQWALSSVLDPARAADLIRQLLVNCGLGVFADGFHEYQELPARIYLWFGSSWHPDNLTIELRQIPAIILALLDVTDRDAALVALRGGP